jgi:hypothetical protein
MKHPEGAFILLVVLTNIFARHTLLGLRGFKCLAYKRFISPPWAAEHKFSAYMTSINLEDA